MRKLFAVSVIFLLILALTACSGSPAPAPPSSPNGEDIPNGSHPPVQPDTSVTTSSPNPLHIPELAVELPRSLDAASARKAMERLPAALKKYNVQVDTVSISFGPTYSATVAALQQASVQLAFLPAEDYVTLGGANVILADTCPDENGSILFPGVYTQICTAPSAYGIKLAELAASRSTLLSWEELDQARWGVLDDSSLSGHRCLRLWLEDNYEDNNISDLRQVTIYDSWGDLLRAAAAEEIDLFPLPPDTAANYASRWNSDFGRPAPFDQEVIPVGISDGICTWVAAAAPEDAVVNNARFIQALAAAINSLFDSPAKQASAIGAEHYAPASDRNLNPLRRLILSES